MLLEAVRRIESACQGISFVKGIGFVSNLKEAYGAFSSVPYYPAITEALQQQSIKLGEEYGIPSNMIFAYLANVKGITSASTSLTRNAQMSQTLSNIGAMDGLYQYLKGKMGNTFDPKALTLVGNELKVKISPKVWETIPSELLKPFSSVPKEFIRKSLMAYHRTVGEGITAPNRLLLQLIDDGVYSNIGVGRWVVPAKTGAYSYLILTDGSGWFVPIDRHHLRQFLALPERAVLAKSFLRHFLYREPFDELFRQTADSIRAELVQLSAKNPALQKRINRRLKQITPDYLRERLAFRLADVIYSYANGLEMQRGVWALAEYMMREYVGVRSPLGEHYAKLWMAQRIFPMSTPSYIFDVAKIMDEMGEVGVELKDLNGYTYIVKKGEESYKRLSSFIKALETETRKASKGRDMVNYNPLLLEAGYDTPDKRLALIKQELSALKEGIIGRYTK